MRAFFLFILLCCYTASAIKFRSSQYPPQPYGVTTRVLPPPAVSPFNLPPLVPPHVQPPPTSLYGVNNQYYGSGFPMYQPQYNMQSAYTTPYSNQMTQATYAPAINPFQHYPMQRPPMNQAVQPGQMQGPGATPLQPQAIVPALLQAGLSAFNAPRIDFYKDPYLKREPRVTMNSAPVEYKKMDIDDLEEVGSMAQQYKRSVLEEQADAMEAEDRTFDDIKAEELHNLRKKNAQLAAAIKKEMNKLHSEGI